MTTKAQANEDEVVPKVGSNRKLADNILPMARICKIMRFSPEINMIATESSYLVCCATEHFIRYIATEAYKNAGEKGLNYKALANYIQNEEKMDFLQAIIPHKITVKKYREIMEKENIKNLDFDASESSDDDEEGEEEESEEEEEGSSSDEEKKENEKAKTTPKKP